MQNYIDHKKICIPPIGFKNTGAICYFNALIQCLLSSTRFIEFSLTLDEKNHKNTVFIDFFRHIVNDMWNVMFTTKLLIELNGFNPNQSSSEYFIKIVDELMLEKLFECKYQIRMKCMKCGFEKVTTDVTYNVLVDKSFDELFHTESQLENVLCDGCKQKTLYSEERRLNDVSNMIVVSFNKYFGKHLISYPTSFKMNEHLYEMTGTVEHFGVLNAGHYVARTTRLDADENRDKHYIFDDERVVEIDEDTFSKSMQETYMIFYQKK